MSNSYRTVIQSQCQSLAPKPTGVDARLSKLDGIRAVLFDVYGTLFISASGEVGTATDEGRATALSQAFAAVGLALHGDLQYGVRCWLDAIHDSHAQSKSNGVEYPEVNIVAIWTQCLQRLAAEKLLDGSVEDVDPRELAVQYEVRTNPTWPMPGLPSCLQELGQRDVLLGIISNAQFFTLELFPALLGKTLDELEFRDDLQFYSYRYLRAKPGLPLYQMAADAISARGLRPRDVLYIGNDMLNDVWGANRVGFRTALFAGDARSLRWRDGDARVAGLRPDLIVTNLEQVTSCL
jgi:putative hydrolase of the HAD superfamily